MTFKPLFLTGLFFAFLTAVSLLAFNYYKFGIFHVLSLIFFCSGFSVFLFGYILKMTGKLKK